MLTYKNDLLLIDGTANDLIETGKENLLFLDKDRKILNLYSALVKRKDFIKEENKKNQILQKVIYVSGKKLKEKITIYSKKLFKNERDLLNKIGMYTTKRTCLSKGTKRWFDLGIFPLVLLRIIAYLHREKDTIILSDLLNEVDYFTDFLNKARCILPKEVKELLRIKNSYLAGCSLGDGHIEKNQRRWVLVEGTGDKDEIEKSKEFVRKIEGLIKDNFINKTRFVEKPTKNIIIIESKPFCRFLNFFFDMPIGVKIEQDMKKPKILEINKQLKNSLNITFWRGYFDTDGSINKEGSIGLSSLNPLIIIDCKNDLKELGINPQIHGPELRINIADVAKFKKIGFANTRKQSRLLNFLEKGSTSYEYQGIKKNSLVNGKFKIDLVRGGYKNIKLPEKPNKELLNLIKFLRPWGHKVRIRIKDANREKINIKELNQLMKRLFNIECKTFTKKNTPFIYSKEISQFLDKFFIYEPPWKPILQKEKEELIKEWDKVWD